ncbi:MAG: substrate-binding domain-containing protein [Betaproteobacteria bacterium]
MANTVLHLISAGAAKGLVEALVDEWAASTQMTIDGSFGAVGAMKDKLLAGAPCDVLVLTQVMLEELAARKAVVADSIRPLGRVFTGVAVCSGAARPLIDSPAALRQSVLAATAIYIPDPHRATAGIHFANVLKQLGIDEVVAPRLRAFPNGAAAMREMASANDPEAIGCTQVTEILYTEHVALVGLLPPAFELATLYSVAVCTGSLACASARRFADLLAGDSAAALRARGGFQPPSSDP